MKPIYVTQPRLPPLEEFVPCLEQIWQNKILTNNGPFHKQLEQALCEYRGVEHLSVFTNGTIALVSALQAPDQAAHREFRAGDVRHSQADIIKAPGLLGYAPTRRLPAGLSAAMPWYTK
jgi:dTDP-4-amino-4,6-dideoxygalactose transaminase